MGVKCRISLKKVKGDVYRPGQPVTGKVEYSIDKPTKFESIDLYFVGKGKCFWSESDSGDTTYYRNEEEYVSVHKDLLTASNGETVEEEDYINPFHFALPENIPTSIKTKKCTIKYKIIVIFVEANFFKITKKFDVELTVCSYVNPCPLQPAVFKLKTEQPFHTRNNEAKVRVELEKKMVAPGEDIKLSVIIKNDPELPIKYLKSKLMKHLTFISDVGRTFTESGPVMNTKGCSPNLKRQSESSFTCLVPTMPRSCTIQHSKILIGEYKVRVTVKYPFPHPKATIDIPVIIGETKDPFVDKNQQHDQATCSKMLNKEDIRPGREDQQVETPSCSKISQKKEEEKSLVNENLQDNKTTCSVMPEKEDNSNPPAVQDKQDEIPSSSHMLANEQREEQNEKLIYSISPETNGRIDPPVVEIKQDEKPSSSQMQVNEERRSLSVVEDQDRTNPSSCSEMPDKDGDHMKNSDTVVVKLL